MNKFRLLLGLKIQPPVTWFELFQMMIVWGQNGAKIKTKNVILGWKNIDHIIGVNDVPSNVMLNNNHYLDFREGTKITNIVSEDLNMLLIHNYTSISNESIKTINTFGEKYLVSEINTSGLITFKKYI